MEVLAKTRGTELIQLIPEALKFRAVHRRCTSVCDRATFAVPVTSTFAAGRRTSDAINNFDRASASALSLAAAQQYLPLLQQHFSACPLLFSSAVVRFSLHNGTSRKAHASAQPRSALYSSSRLRIRVHAGSNYPFEYVSFEWSIEKLFWLAWSRNRRRMSWREPLWKRDCRFYSLHMCIYFLYRTNSPCRDKWQQNVYAWHAES